MTSKKSFGLMIGALGVVYGDIGTSPLYTMREAFGEATELQPTAPHVLGVLSLVFWALMLVVTVKYVIFILRADNRGEGGILALTALALSSFRARGRWRKVIVMLGIFGAALFYGDGAITPAISVMGAVEGLSIAAPVFSHLEVPIVLFLLMTVFLVQRHGTGRVGALFGPIILVWFLTIGVLGAVELVQQPAILAAINPYYAVSLLMEEIGTGFSILGAVFLAVTGAEALYADMGHFGRPAIRRVWLFLVLPCLLLNYFGQGALILTHPETIENPFYLLAPDWFRIPLLILATLAAIIASQAVISGVFSMTRQAVQLGYLPRLEIRHTSESAIGQIYVPRANHFLALLVVLIVIGFQNSSNLASAYGIAVAGMMVITTSLAYIVARGLAKWPIYAVLPLAGLFFIVDGFFLIANGIKFSTGGWFPVAIGLAILTVMLTWRRGRNIVFQRLYSSALSLDKFIDRLRQKPIALRAPGTAVFMTGNADVVPIALLHNLKHNHVLHDRVVVLSVVTEDIPRLAPEDRVEIVSLPLGFVKITLRYGFMEQPDIPKALREDCARHGIQFDPMQTSFFMNRQRFVRGSESPMPPWQESLFILLSNNAVPATDFFHLPPNRVVELGGQTEI